MSSCSQIASFVDSPDFSDSKILQSRKENSKTKLSSRVLKYSNYIFRKWHSTTNTERRALQFTHCFADSKMSKLWFKLITFRLQHVTWYFKEWESDCQFEPQPHKNPQLSG